MAYPFRSWLAAAGGLLTVLAHATPAPSGAGAGVGGGFVSLGDDAEFGVSFAGAVRVDDNILLRETATSDTLFTFTPGVRVSFGKNSLHKGGLELRDEFSAYARDRGRKDQLFSGDYFATFDDGKTKITTTAGFAEENRPTVELRGLVRRATARLGGAMEQELSQLWTVAVGFNGSRTDFRRPGFSEAKVAEVPVDVYWRYSEKTDLSFGYQQRETNVDLGRDATDRFYSVGLRGELTPKLRGSGKVGVTSRERELGGTWSGLGLATTLTYEAGFADFIFTAQRDSGTSPLGLSENHLDVGARAATNLGQWFVVWLDVKARRIDYEMWTDNYREVQFGCTHTWNDYIQLSADYTWRHNASALRSSRFSNNVFTLSADLRF